MIKNEILSSPKSSEPGLTTDGWGLGGSKESSITSVCLIADCFEFMPSAQRTDQNGGIDDETTEEMKEEMKEEPNGKAGAGKPKRKAKGSPNPEENIPF